MCISIGDGLDPLLGQYVALGAALGDKERKKNDAIVDLHQFHARGHGARMPEQPPKVVMARGRIAP
jgi:hypothetical protein